MAGICTAVYLVMIRGGARISTDVGASLGAAGVLWMARTGAGGGWVTMAGALDGAPVAGVCGAGPESGAHRSPWPRAIDLAERRGRPHTVQRCCWALSVGAAIGGYRPRMASSI